MKRETMIRAVIYVAGLLILAMGLTLNTKAGLGVSPIISVSYCVSEITGFNFGNMTMFLYLLFLVVELILHLNYYKGRERKAVLIKDVLQIPLSMIFTRFLNLFSALIPNFYEGERSVGRIVIQCIVLVIAVALTGIGAAMSLNMRVVPNPADGIVQAISDTIHKSMGFTKNCFDLFNVLVTITVGLVFAGRLYGIGVGTIVTVLGVGRVIALFNHLLKDKMLKSAGISN